MHPGLLGHFGIRVVRCRVFWRGVEILCDVLLRVPCGLKNVAIFFVENVELPSGHTSHFLQNFGPRDPEDSAFASANKKNEMAVGAGRNVRFWIENLLGKSVEVFCSA